jgi:hypothetical protein
MQMLNFPQYTFRIQDENGKKLIFDSLRKKWVALAPEEWVRQHLVQYLISEKGFPSGLITVEQSLKYNGLTWRTDVLVYSKNRTPLLLAECKAPEVEITQETFNQAGRYNIVHKVPYLLISNGLSHYCCFVDMANGKTQFLNEIPRYENLL